MNRFVLAITLIGLLLLKHTEVEGAPSVRNSALWKGMTNGQMTAGHQESAYLSMNSRTGKRGPPDDVCEKLCRYVCFFFQFVLYKIFQWYVTDTRSIIFSWLTCFQMEKNRIYPLTKRFFSTISWIKLKHIKTSMHGVSFYHWRMGWMYLFF